MFELRHVSKSYFLPQTEQELNILSDVSLSCQPGQTIAITGPSGSGKTTLLNIMGCLDYPTSGKVLLDAQDLNTLSEKERAIFRNQYIGFIFQQHHLLPQLTVLENVLLPTLVTKSDVEQKRQYAHKLLELVGLEQRLQHLPSQLSGGEQQRVAVVRALINQPKLVLADEPTGSLDQKTSENLAELLLSLNAELHTTFIVVTHSLHLAEQMQLKYNLIDGHLEES